MEQYLETTRGRTIAALFLLVLYILLYLAILGVRPLFIPDEPRYGEIAREMLDSGNWIVPRLNGLLYFEKPPLGHWLNAISMSIFGETEYGVRFSSALSTGIATLLVFWIGRGYFKSCVVPFLGAFIFLTTLEVQAVGTHSVLDPAFSVLLNGGIFLMASSAYRSGRQRLLLLVPAGVLFGLAFLTKGFLAFALPVVIVVPWLVVRKQYNFLFKHSWVAIIFAVLTIAPWAIAINAEQPDFWRYFFWVEHVQRFASADAQHKEPFYYFFMFLPALAFPWIFLLPTAIKGLKSEFRSRATPGYLFLLILWVVVPLVFFSIAKGKLATYILPCFVPFSVLAGVGLSSSIGRGQKPRASLLSAAGAVLVLLSAVVIYAGKSEDAVFLPAQRPEQAVLYVAILLAAAIFLFGAFAKEARNRVLSAGLAIVPPMIVLPFAMPEAVLRTSAPQSFLEETIASMPDGTTLVSSGSLVRAISWAAKRSDIYVIENGGEISYGLSAPDGKNRFLEPEDLRNLIAAAPGVLIVCKKGCRSETISALPAQTTTTSYGIFHAYHVASE